jgi:hypothetical protein
MALTRKVGLKRTGFSRKASPKPFALATAKTQMKRTAIKAKARKVRPWHDKAALEACRGQICWLKVPGVCYQLEIEETIVPAHSNFSEHGKGGARKADDKYSLPSCMRCHAWLDTGTAPIEEKRTVFMPALGNWMSYRDGEAA